MSLLEDAAETALTAAAPELALPAKILSWLCTPSAIAIAVLAAATAVQTVRIEGLHIRPHIGPIHFTLLSIDGFKDDAARAEAALAAVKAAQPKAAAAQAAVNHEPAAKSAAIAEASNHDAQTYYAKGRAAGAAYAAAHLVRPACDTGSPGGADLPRSDRAPTVDDGPGGTAGMVALSRADFDLLTGNSLRLAKVYQDAQSLIAQGVAIPSTAAAEKP